jgi:glucan phosphoethanolaminetransferase (alkaline phosphatase superfamily)
MLTNRQVVARLALDVLVWCCAPAAFLLVYVTRYHAPGESVPAHLRLVFLALLGTALARLVLAVVVRRSAWLRFAATLLVATLLATMVLYYAVVLLGLQYWGRVTTWELFASYALQASQLAEALEISAPLVLGLVALGYTALLAASWAYFGRFDWASHVARHAPRRVVGAALICASGIALAELAVYLDWPRSAQGEPVSLTFFSTDGALNLQGHGVDSVSAMQRDELEDAARAAYRPSGDSERKNLILIVVDALRSDHMGVYGYPRETTPVLSRLAREGKVRKAGEVRAVCASSACGLLGIAGSKFVHQFSNRPILLYEVLRRHGYRVHMVLSGDHTTFYGLKKAYGELDSYFDARSAGGRKYLNDDQLVLERLATFPQWDGNPVMIQFHLMSAHVLARGSAQSEAAQADGTLSARELHIRPYERAIVRADRIIGELLESLERKGYLQRAMVAITSDHGEGFGEHGIWLHARGVYEEMLRIPLLLVSYGEPPGMPIDRHPLASQVDIAPTLLVELGLPRPSTWAGTPLQESAFREFSYFQQQALVGLFDHRETARVWKYWTNSRTGEEHAYDLRADPGETANAMGAVDPALARAWRRRVLPGRSVYLPEAP